MYQNINVAALKIVDAMQREKNRTLGGSVIIIDNYFGSQHNWVCCRPQLPVILFARAIGLNTPRDAVKTEEYQMIFPK